MTHPKNKGRRQEINKTKFIRRVKVRVAKVTYYPHRHWTEALKDHRYKSLRTSGKPCSCILCSPTKYHREWGKQELVKLKKEFIP